MSSKHFKIEIVNVVVILAIIFLSLMNTYIRSLYTELGIFSAAKVFLYSIFLIFILYILPGHSLLMFFEKHIRYNLLYNLLASFIVLPIVYSFLAIFIDTSFKIFIFSIIILLLISYAISKKVKPLFLNHAFELPILKNFYLIIFIVLFLLLVMIPRTYLPLNKAISVGDDFKHLASIVSITSSDKFPANYNYPVSKLSYNYYIYTFPGLMTKYSGNIINVSTAWFDHIIIQTILSIVLVISFVFYKCKSIYGRAVSLLLFTLMGGYKFFLMAIRYLLTHQLAGHLEWWFTWFPFTETINFQITSFYSLFLYVPQYLIAALFIIPVFFILFKAQENKMKYIILAIIIAASLGYGTFTGLGVLTVVSLYFLLKVFKKIMSGVKNSLDELKKLTIFCLSLLFFSIPLFFIIDKVSIMSFKLSKISVLSSIAPGVITNLTDFILTIPFQLIVELGVIVIFCLIFLLLHRKKFLGSKENLFLFLALLLFIPAYFVQSANNNDFGMRFIIPAQMSLFVFSGIVVDSFESKLRHNRLILTLLIILIIASMTNMAWEFIIRARWVIINDHLPSYFMEVDKATPLNSIVLSDKDDPLAISIYGHRLSLKSIKDFDKLYLQYIQTRYLNDTYTFNSIDDVCSFLSTSENTASRPLFYINHSFEPPKIINLSCSR